MLERITKAKPYYSNLDFLRHETQFVKQVEHRHHFYTTRLSSVFFFL